MMRWVLVILATARVTRLLTEDHLGRWYFRDPIEAWGDRAEAARLDQAARALQDNAFQESGGVLEQMVAEYDDASPWTWQKRLSEGASCVHCVGFWVGALILGVDVLTRTRAFGWARPLYQFVVGALAVNTVVGMAKQRDWYG